MSDLDTDFSLGDDSEEPFDADEAEEEEEDGEDFAAASDESDLEDLAPKPKKARVSATKPVAKKTPPPKPKATSSSSAVKKTATFKATASNTTKSKSPAAAAKKSPKPKPMRAGDAEAAVLDYMRKTNRPYSLLNVFENMHRVIAKPSLTKLLDNLVVKEELASKTYGKAKIYYLNQNNLPVPSEEERLAIEEQIKTVTAECTASEQELKSAEATLSGISSQISDADLDAALNQLEDEAAALETKVETLDQPGRAPVSPGRKNALKRKFTKYRTAWVQRKRIAMDGVNQIADGMEKKPKAVLDLVGVETDEEAGIKTLPTI
ncbi:TBPIP/Hop2 winged helix domain-containing protein [Phytophthora infestans]|uniref:TBPIP/Hop2 winged helix domain-containing protein n=1 Tax=Phytophthora infestans TaxID=4787 RepID=A0A8S9UD36_PHYIN|nr:TBPIP/Hop2 winged helix domain-containing protein [Phytophthora infestans]